jgi:DNA-binding MarR family transcriptional regulator
MDNEPIRSDAAAAWMRVMRIYQSLDRRSEETFRELGLNAAWFDVLARVGARQGMTQIELAESLLVTKGNISQLIVKLEAAGLVERRAEGRSQHLYLTAAGRDLRNKALPRQEAMLTGSLSTLSVPERKELLRLLRKWENA